MCDLNACRACLAVGVKLCNIMKSPLRVPFGTATGFLLRESYGLPPYLCAHCCFTVQRFDRFRRLCHKSHNTMMLLLSKGMLSTKSIKLEKREQHLSISNVDVSQYIHSEEELQGEDKEALVNAVVLRDVGSAADYVAPLRDINWIAEQEDYRLTIDIVKEETVDSDYGETHITPLVYPDVSSTVNKMSIETVIANDKEPAKIPEFTKPTTSQTTFICDKCKKEFNSKKAIYYHLGLHTEKTQYRCAMCNKSFKTRSHYSIHKRRHAGERPYECKTCRKFFYSKSDVDKHERTHTGEKPYKCNKCEKTFSLSSHLTIHQRKHTGEKPYKCNTCSKLFIDSSSLSRHNKIHTGEKAHKCTTCDKSFVVKKDLINHLRVHTGEKPYKCETCGKSFVNSSGLCRHKRLHLEAKAFKCDVCSKSFSTKEYCSQHKETHTKPLACTFCGKLLSSKRALEAHEKIHDH